MIIPNVVQKTPNGERGFDIYSRLLDDRIIMLDGEVNDQMASIIVAELLYLDAQGDGPISMYINSPGGSVTAGLAIIDTMNYIKSDVVTIVTGMAASMGAMILLSGAKGKRFALPHSEVMIHQPLGGAQGQASDIIIAADHISRTRTTLYKMIAEASGKTLKKVEKDAERDNFMNAKEALDYGLIDKIIEHK